eukprot:gene6772-10936_t
MKNHQEEEEFIFSFIQEPTKKRNHFEQEEVSPIEPVLKKVKQEPYDFTAPFIESKASEICEFCETNEVLIYCQDCEQSQCEDCFQKYYQTEKRKKHQHEFINQYTYVPKKMCFS